MIRLAHVFPSLLALAFSPVPLTYSLPQSPPARPAAQAATRERATVEIDRYCRGLGREIERARLRERYFSEIKNEGLKGQWRELKEYSQVRLWTSAVAWQKAGRVVAVEFFFSSGADDWVHYVMYFFRPDGTLAKIEARLNTFYGHVTAERQRHFDSRGKLLKADEQFYKLGTREKTTPSEGADEFIDKPIPLFKTTAELPFHHLLKSKQSARKS